MSKLVGLKLRDCDYAVVSRCAEFNGMSVVGWVRHCVFSMSSGSEVNLAVEKVNQNVGIAAQKVNQNVEKAVKEVNLAVEIAEKVNQNTIRTPKEVNLTVDRVNLAGSHPSGCKCGMCIRDRKWNRKGKDSVKEEN